MAIEKGHETGLAGRYANAVFELAEEQNALDAVAADFTALKTMLAQSRDFALLVRSPAFTHEQQQRVLKPILAAMGAHPLTAKFVQTLAHKRRLFALEDVIAAYHRLLAKLRGEVEADVASARPLSEAETQQLRAVLKDRLGREPRIHARVDPALLGGLVVKVGSRMIDSSLRTKLNGLAVAMRG